MKTTKKAFTMAEVLMVLAVLGIIAAILIPAIATLKPDQNRVMFKKAYYLTERLIAEIVNDEQLYSTTEDKVGFPNSAAPKILKIDTSTGQPKEEEMEIKDLGDANGTKVEGNSKLCLLFMDRLNLLAADSGTNAAVGCKNSSGTSSSAFPTVSPSFKTVDGMWWYFPTGTWNEGSEKHIWVDTNGDKKPNCRCTSASNKVCNGSLPAGVTCKKPDRFIITVRSDGKMSIPSGAKEEEYLRAATTISDK